MKHWMTWGIAGLLVTSLPAVALAQDAPETPAQTAPQTQPQAQPQPQSPTRDEMQQQPTTPQKTRQDMPMRRQAPDQASQEVATAHAHALMAQNAKSVDQAHTHLHHVVNCLEGPQGQDFDADAGNPCDGKGQGALVDSQSNASLQSSLQQALDEARSGLQTDELAQAQKHAANAAGMLQAGSTDDGMMHHQGQ